jgi:hypothetical protein
VGSAVRFGFSMVERCVSGSPRGLSCGKEWVHLSQIQRLVCYGLHYPGTIANNLAEEKEFAKPQKCAHRQSFC